MAPDGTDQRRLTHTPVDEGAPTFSPDGKEIA
jgi:Tol biopolymer transport system component